MGHEIFKAAPKSPSLTREKLQSMLEQYDFQAEQIIRGISVSDLYYSAKIPFQFDYGDKDKDGMPGDKGSHGTHVASTAAGNTGVNEAAMGVAPQAQIINMNVFKSTGGASYADILAALEDCILLGVDVANLSLGSDCGYIDYDSEDAFTKSLLDVFERTGESGVSLAVAAGNAYNAAYGDAFGGKALASNPDYGLVSEPSTYGESLSVAAVSNGMVKGPYVTVGGKNLAYQDSATISEDENAKPFRSLSARGSIEYVVVPNYGAEEDYAGLDLTGKIALVQRGGGMYYEQKERAAANAGAIGMLVYNNVPGMLYMSITDWKIPCAFISQAAGEYMKQQQTKTLSVAAADALVESPTYGMADFSSWGATPELTLKPEITAPGAGIYAAVPGGYESMDGTSMASPHAASGMVIVQQALKARDNSMTGAQRKHMTDTLLMSIAHVIYDDNGVPYSPPEAGRWPDEHQRRREYPGLSVRGGHGASQAGAEGRSRHEGRVHHELHRPQHRQRHPGCGLRIPAGCRCPAAGQEKAPELTLKSQVIAIAPGRYRVPGLLHRTFDSLRSIKKSARLCPADFFT